jgi:hypothetical protein
MKTKIPVLAAALVSLFATGAAAATNVAASCCSCCCPLCK